VVETRFGYHIIQLIDKDDNRMHTRHILALFDRSKTDVPATIALLQSIRADILSGKTTFAAMARKYSDDPASAASGGVIASASGSPNLEYATIRPDLRKIIDGLKTVGAVSQPEMVRPEKGAAFYALFRLDGRQPAHVLTPENDFAEIQALARNYKSQQLFNAWIEKLKKEVVVRIMSDV